MDDADAAHSFRQAKAVSPRKDPDYEGCRENLILKFGRIANNEHPMRNRNGLLDQQINPR